MTELKEVPNYEDYKVDTEGNVFSKRLKTPLIPNDTRGYKSVFLYKDGKFYRQDNVNDYSIGIVICGDHRLEDGNINREVIPKKQYNALVWSLAHIQNLYPQFTNIIGHTSVSTSGKSCPNLYMDELKSDVKKKRLMELITKWVFIAFLFGSIVAIGRKILYYD